MDTLSRVIVGLLIAALSIGVQSQAPKIETPSGKTAPAAAKAERLSTARVNGVELHYLDRGQGEPIVFVHGGLADYREWEPVANFRR